MKPNRMNRFIHTCQEGKKCYEESRRYPLAVLLWWWQ
jgi:hypothetical protein